MIQTVECAECAGACGLISRTLDFFKVNLRFPSSTQCAGVCGDQIALDRVVFAGQRHSASVRRLKKAAHSHTHPARRAPAHSAARSNGPHRRLLLGALLNLQATPKPERVDFYEVVAPPPSMA